MAKQRKKNKGFDAWTGVFGLLLIAGVILFLYMHLQKPSAPVEVRVGVYRALVSGGYSITTIHVSERDGSIFDAIGEWDGMWGGLSDTFGREAILEVSVNGDGYSDTQVFDISQFRYSSSIQKAKFTLPGTGRYAVTARVLDAGGNVESSKSTNYEVT